MLGKQSTPKQQHTHQTGNQNLCLPAGFLASWHTQTSKNILCMCLVEKRLLSPGRAAEQKCKQDTISECRQIHTLQGRIVTGRQGLPTGTHPATRPTHLFHDDQVSDLDVGTLHLHGPCKGTGPRYIMTEFTATPLVFIEHPPAFRVNTVCQM